MAGFDDVLIHLQEVYKYILITLNWGGKKVEKTSQGRGLRVFFKKSATHAGSVVREPSWLINNELSFFSCRDTEILYIYSINYIFKQYKYQIEYKKIQTYKVLISKPSTSIMSLNSGTGWLFSSVIEGWDCHLAYIFAMCSLHSH